MSKREKKILYTKFLYFYEVENEMKFIFQYCILSRGVHNGLMAMKTFFFFFTLSCLEITPFATFPLVINK